MVSKDMLFYLNDIYREILFFVCNERGLFLTIVSGEIWESHIL